MIAEAVSLFWQLDPGQAFVLGWSCACLLWLAMLPVARELSR